MYIYVYNAPVICVTSVTTVHPLCNADVLSISICDAIEVPYC